MTVMAWFDPATACGFAVGAPGRVAHGEWDLSRTKHDSWGMSCIWLEQRLDELHKATGFTVLGYEKANFHVSLDATELRGALVATIQRWCAIHGIPHTAAGPSTIKKFWTGKGNASKADMIAEARRRQHEVDTDNEADALAGWYWLQAQASDTASARMSVPSVVHAKAAE